MTIDAFTDVLRADLQAADKVLLLGILYLCKGDGEQSECAHNKLARLVNMPDRTIYRVLKRLQKAGKIHVTRRGPTGVTGLSVAYYSPAEAP